VQVMEFVVVPPPADQPTVFIDPVTLQLPVIKPYPNPVLTRQASRPPHPCPGLLWLLPAAPQTDHHDWL
jgi:hypothetical protein